MKMTLAGAGPDEKVRIPPDELAKRPRWRSRRDSSI